jgi:hypothetical protein
MSDLLMQWSKILNAMMCSKFLKTIGLKNRRENSFWNRAKIDPPSPGEWQPTMHFYSTHKIFTTFFHCFFW